MNNYHNKNFNTIKTLFTTFITILCMLFCIFISYLIVDYFNFFGNTNIQNENSLTKAFDENAVINPVDAVPETTKNIKLIPLGNLFGIKIYTDGLIVSSLQNIEYNGISICPAQKSGIKAGDFVLKVNGVNIKSNIHFTQMVTENLDKDIVLEIKRDENIFETTITPVFDGEYYRLGMWIRDSAAGIGTLTYFNPQTNTFAGLGHGICDVDTSELMTIKGGEPAPVTISNIEKGTNGIAGKICGYFSSNTSLGILTNNTKTGIYGELNAIPDGKALPVAYENEIKKGKAEIICTLETGVSSTYSIQIEDINNRSSETKNMIIKITDKELLDITGGIIQGMSGSPIIQDGKIIGAVTHVFVNDSTRGYGIFIENMLETECLNN